METHIGAGSSSIAAIGPIAAITHSGGMKNVAISSKPTVSTSRREPLTTTTARDMLLVMLKALATIEAAPRLEPDNG